MNAAPVADLEQVLDCDVFNDGPNSRRISPPRLFGWKSKVRALTWSKPSTLCSMNTITAGAPQKMGELTRGPFHLSSRHLAGLKVRERLATQPVVHFDQRSRGLSTQHVVLHSRTFPDVYARAGSSLRTEHTG